MQAERWERIKQVYNSALRIEPQQREAFLDEACAGDEWLRREIEQLLAQGSQADGFLESPALEIAARAIAVEEQGSELAGRALLHYRVIEKIGEGGMGVVYRARDERLQRDVAIKVLAGAALPNERARTQLLREARAAAALNHPNICTVHEAGNADGHAYVAMELVEGKSVSALLEQGPLSFEHTVRYGVQLADALAHAHARGIVHRDLKSANVVVNREGRAKVLDFGLAKRLDVRAWNEITRSQATETAPGMVAGTLAYMAPEQLRGEAADVRSDIWSLGVVLYEMAAGVRPFRGRTWSELSSAILNEGPAPLPGRASGALWAVIGRCLEKNPQRRYQTADDARAALDALQTGSASLWATWSSMPPRRRLLGLAVLPPILAALLAAVHPAWFRQALGKGPPRVRTVAVLPLEDLTPGSQEGYLAEGLHEALITDLHRLNGLRVIARPSVMTYRGSRKPLSQIAAELRGVDALVAGAVLLAGGRAQVTVQLIDAGSGEILWTDRYLREMRDVLALQNEIVAKIVQGIRLKVSPEEKTRLASVRAVKPETYELCAKGRFFLDKLTPEGFQKGLGYLKQAAANDPEEPLASAGVALGYVLMAHQGPAAEVPDAFERAKPYALKAMELDPTLPEAHQALAEINGYWDWNYSGAETEYRRALELSNGNIPEAHAHYSWLLAALERPDEQIAEMKRALEIDPLNPTYHIWLGQYHLEAGRRDESLIEARKALELNPETPDALVLLGDGYALGGDFSKAIANQEKAAARDPGLSRYALACTYARAGRGSEARRIAEDLRKRLRRWDAYGLAMIYAALGEKDEAFRWLEAMYRGRHPYAPWIRHFSPEFTAWQRDPRFVDLTRRLRLPNVR